MYGFVQLLTALQIITTVYALNGDECSETICNPSAGDLLIGRESLLRASSTCGLRDMERYCIVTASDRSKKTKCDICYSKDPYNAFSSRDSHRIESVVSRIPRNDKRWWQSENGIHNVSIEVNFESEFQFIYTHLRFKTYRPAAMYIERSKDYGKTWQVYKYFSNNCARDFPRIPRKRRDISDVSCTQEYSSISPSEGGAVIFIAAPSDIDTNPNYWRKKRNDVTAITNLRVQFIRLHTFGDWRIDNNNPNVKDKYYYAVSEWIIRGRCSCYGHASRCKPKEGQMQTREMVYGVCDCQHNTVGQHCEKCKDFYSDRPWMPANKTSTNECRKCNCNDHATRCYFNPYVFDQSGNKSGGVCDRCQHNTEGNNCQKCQIEYYRNPNVPIYSPYTCIKCQCNRRGSLLENKTLCVQENDQDSGKLAGSCYCKENVGGYYCDRCKVGYWNFKVGCIKCVCNIAGVVNHTQCHQDTGSCICKANVEGKSCSECKNGYFNLLPGNPLGCSSCDCDSTKSRNSDKCNKQNGQCNCKLGYAGRRCNEIKNQWYVEKPNYPLNKKQKVNISIAPVRDIGYYDIIFIFRSEQMMVSDMYILNVTVGQNRSQTCKPYSETKSITQKEKMFVINNKCLDKGIKIDIIIETLIQKGKNENAPAVVEIIVMPVLDPNNARNKIIMKECFGQEALSPECEFIRSQIATKLKPTGSPKECNCNVTGSVNNICEKIGGQCSCLRNVVDRKCDKCSPNAYGFSANGCTQCECHAEGSLSLQCDLNKGDCLCRNNIDGKNCNKCKLGYWNFPFCVPCQCNELSNTCDQDTGRCLNCQDNTFGYNCQHCKIGFYGNPDKRIPCLPCKCPGLVHSNLDHSIGCNLIFNTTTYLCLCKSGYKGKTCNQCDDNYYGNPISKGGTCKPCLCSNNIDHSVSGNCNSSTGECVNCLYNTRGFSCEKCAYGYFGNGPNRTCKKCVCNHLGTDMRSKEYCDSSTGQCKCMSNVIGQSCDKCMEGFFNITSKFGCTKCNCNYPIGAKSKTCSQLTGQCDCRQGRSGRRCNQCENGFWGNPEIKNGCRKCNCNKEGSQYMQCNRITGDCVCNTGVTGTYCDRCDRGTNGKLPNCAPCGDCWKNWFFSIKRLENRLENPNLNFRNITSSSLFKEINNLIDIINAIDVKYIKMSAVDSLRDKMNTNISFILTFQNESISNYSKILADYKEKIDNVTKEILSAKIKDVTGAYAEIMSLKERVLKINDQLNVTNHVPDELLAQVNARYTDSANISINDTLEKNVSLERMLQLLSEILNRFKQLTCNMSPKCLNSLECSLDKCNDIRYSATYGNFYSSSEKCKETITNITRILNKIMGKKDFQNILDFQFKKLKNMEARLDNVSMITPDDLKNATEILKSLQQKLINPDSFQQMLDEIRNFTIELNEKEIENLISEIERKRKSLTKVDDILKKSSENRKACDDLKKKVLELKARSKQILDSFLKSINLKKNIEDKLPNGSLMMEGLEKNVSKYQNFVDNIRKVQAASEKSLNESKEYLNKVQGMKSRLWTTFNQTDAMLNFLSSINKNKSKELVKRMELLKKKRDAMMKKDNNDGTVDKFKNLKLNLEKAKKKVNDLNSTLINKRQKIEEKVNRVDQLEKALKTKILRLQNLQNEIYEKARYQKNCVP